VDGCASRQIAETDRGLDDSVTPLHTAFLKNHETAKINSSRWRTKPLRGGQPH
jgi:hypothetical protein